VLRGQRSVMAGNRKKTVMIAVAVVAVIAGIVIAVTSSSSHKKKAHQRARVHSGTLTGGSQGSQTSQGEIAVAAKYLGVSVSKLRAEMRKGRSLVAIAAAAHRSPAELVEALVRTRVQRVEAAVAAKTVTPAVAKRRIARIRARVEARVARSANYLATVAIASKYLGLSTAKVRAELRRGHSLAQIADATAGKSAAGLTAAVIAVRERELSAGASSLAGSTALLEALKARAKTEVQRTPIVALAAP
jgi:hypothetical protein